MKRLLLTTLIFMFSVPAQAVTLKIATVAPEASNWMKVHRESAREIKERTEGRVLIKFYGGGIKGSDDKVLSLVRIGSLQGGAFIPSALTSQYPDLNLYGLPMVFDSDEEATFVRGRLDARLMAGLEEAGWVNFGFAAGGFSVLMSSTPVKTLDDLKGKKIWIPEGDEINLHSMNALSLSPVPLPLTDVLMGLQTGLIDIVPMSPIGALVLQWHTKVKYITELPLLYTFGFMAIQKRAFDKVSPGDQAIVREVMEKTYRDLDEMNVTDNRDALAALLKSGLKVSAVDIDEYNKTRAVLAESTAQLGGEGLFTQVLYEEMLRYVDEYRSGQAAE